MRFLAIGVAGLVAVLGTFVPAVAVAESGEELRARGEHLAKDGRYSEAIDAFKAAEKLEPRARHSCFIALAYTRRELWAQAEIFLDLCHKRASPGDPLPEWVPMVDELLKERLALAAPIEIRVEPPTADVKLAISSFANDELMKPRTIHLPPGRHVIIATADGFNDAQKTVEVTDKTPQVVTIMMLPIMTKGPDIVGPIGGGTVSAPSNVPIYVMAGGGVVVVAGALIHATLFRSARNKLVAANELAANDPSMQALAAERYKTAEPDFDRYKTTTIVLYGVGAATVLTGLVLKLTVFKGKESSVQAAMVPKDGGGMFTLEWNR